MSEIMLNVRDAERSLHGAIHGSQVEYLVAALSADPETIEELQQALARFLPREADRIFAHWRSGVCSEPWDAGLGVIDLAARLVMIDSTYSRPGCRGAVAMTDDRGRDVGIRYHVADDWYFTNHALSWEPLAEKRRRARSEAMPVDARAVMFGAVCPFIAEACWIEAGLLEREALRTAISAIHARWLTTPRADLAGQAPRDVLLEREGHISSDLHDRSDQWSHQGACPPGLRPESAAYRCGGFGTHEIIVYYDLVRFLLCDCWDHLARQPRTQPPHPDDLTAEVRRLESVRDEWLATPNFEDFSGHTPALVIEHERARLPEGGSGKEHMIDCDCPLCQMMADLPGPSFWWLDGCNMDDDFAFSFHRTRAEWEAQQREYEEFSRHFDARQAARSADEPALVWQSSFVADDAINQSPVLAVFGLGALLGELIQNLQDAAAEQETIDALNRGFGNLREAVSDASSSLVEPVIDRLVETLTSVAEIHSALAAKCADLEQRLFAFGWRFVADKGDEELPF